MMNLRPANKNIWFYVWLAFIAVTFAGGCLGEASPDLTLGIAGIMSAVFLIIIPVGMVTVCGANMSMERWMGQLRAWRRPSLWTNPFIFRHSLQFVFFVAVILTATGLGCLFKSLWGDPHALAMGLVNLSAAAGVHLGIFLSLRLLHKNFEPSSGEVA